MQATLSRITLAVLISLAAIEGWAHASASNFAFLNDCARSAGRVEGFKRVHQLYMDIQDGKPGYLLEGQYELDLEDKVISQKLVRAQLFMDAAVRSGCADAGSDEHTFFAGFRGGIVSALREAHVMTAERVARLDKSIYYWNFDQARANRGYLEAMIANPEKFVSRLR